MSKSETEIKNAAAQNDKPKPTGPPKSIFREYFESFAVTLIMALFGMTFVIQAVTVPTGSMQNTILVGDYLLVNKFIFAPGGRPVPLLPQREIRRGDIVVFKFPGYQNSGEVSEETAAQAGTPYTTNFVKRVIGLPGETVEFRNNQVYINGELLPEHRVTADLPVLGGRRSREYDNEAPLQVSAEEPRADGEDWNVYYKRQSMELAKRGTLDTSDYSYGASGKPVQVPENSYFVMGDSRDHSLDSRFWGFVHRDLIIGRAMFVYWSCDRSQGASTSLFGCVTNPRFDRIGKFIE